MKTFDQRRNEVTALYDSGQISRETLRMRLDQIDRAQQRNAEMWAGIQQSRQSISSAIDEAHQEDMRRREAETERHKAGIDELAERLGRNEKPQQQGVIGTPAFATTTVRRIETDVEYVWGE